MLRAERIGRPREPHIEALRGLACVLLVSVHVIGDADEGLRLPAGHVLEQLVWFFQPLRMPLFAFISGFVFDARADDDGQLKRKFVDKAHRLLVPLVTVGTLFFVTRAALHGTALTDIWKVYFTAYDQFWYLTATFLVMATSLAAAYSFPAGRVAPIAVCGVVGSGLYLLDLRIDPDWFSITKAFYLAPFFFLGQLFRATDMGKKPLAWRSGLLVGLALLIAALGTLRHLQPSASGLHFGPQGPGMLLLSLSLCTFLFIARWHVDVLARIGPYSYAIFLLHLFFTSGSRELLLGLGIANPYLLFAFGMLVGISGPMLAQHALLAQPSLAWAFLGQRGTKAEPQTPAVRGIA